MKSQSTVEERAIVRVDGKRYHVSIRVLHWLMAVGFLTMWGCGYAMTSLVAEDSPTQELLFGLHISTGVTLLVLLLIRIAMRLAFTPPPLPEELPEIERVGARIGHLGLYVLSVLIIAIGWAETDFGGHGVKWFGVSMPRLFPTLKTLAGINLENATATLHQWLAYTMLALAIVHVVAVVKHRWIDGYDVLFRMTLANRPSIKDCP